MKGYYVSEKNIEEKRDEHSNHLSFDFIRDPLESIMDQEDQNTRNLLIANLVEMLNRRTIHKEAIIQNRKEELKMRSKFSNLHPGNSGMYERNTMEEGEIERQIQDLQRERRQLEIEQWNDLTDRQIKFIELLNQTANNGQKMAILAPDE